MRSNSTNSTTIRNTIQTAGGLLIAAVIGLTTQVSAQTIVAQWNANNASGGSATYLVPSSGTNAASGVAAGYGQSSPPAPFSSVVTTGTPVDPGTDVGGTIKNLSYVVNPPLTSTLSNSVGLSFKVSTAGMAPGEAVKVSWSQTVGWRSSRYWQVLATTDGTTWSLVPSGTGSSISQSVNGLTGAAPYTPISGTANVSVSDTGLIDFRTIDQNLLTANSTTTAPIDPYDVAFVNGISFTFPTGQGFENNPNFGFAIVGSYDPLVGGTDGTLGYKSSFFGLDSTDTTNGYNRSVGSGGSMRLDMVTVTAVPEPATIAAILGGLGLLLALVRRRRSC